MRMRSKDGPLFCPPQASNEQQAKRALKWIKYWYTKGAFFPPGHHLRHQWGPSVNSSLSLPALQVLEAENSARSDSPVKGSLGVYLVG